MNEELLSILDNIEREKGISKEILISAIESALVSAVKKKLGTEEEATVTFDRKTGEIKLLSAEGKPIDSGDFGRIAAQTAKQIIIQKIREAERDVIFTEFQAKVGDITNGAVHRLERNGIIIDLGRSEAILPYKELIPKEKFKQGDRVRACIVEVKKTPKGPQIILSRAHTGLVKRLFELEVPEIYQGIVEFKGIAREPGDRTKVAVSSSDEKVDCVGACVGMRGTRIKNIVRELKGEKIDIVRWSSDVKQYIANALSPAKVLDIKINEQAKKVDITVADDQLSLAIGKKGQNVRLAAKLTGWGIDINSQAERKPEEKPAVEKEKKEKKVKKEKKAKKEGLTIPGVGPKIRAALAEAGYTTVESLLKLDEKTLLEIKGIGKKTVEKILEFIKTQQ